MFIHYGLDYFVYRSLVVIVNKREHFILIKFLPFAILINHPLSSNFFLFNIQYFILHVININKFYINIKL